MNVRDYLINEGIDAATVDTFLAWHLANPTVWKMFESKALDLIAKGKRKWGAKAIAEIIRYERAEIEGGQFEDYGMNNDYPAYYARVFDWKYPLHNEFFEKREVRGLRRVA